MLRRSVCFLTVSVAALGFAIQSPAAGSLLPDEREADAVILRLLDENNISPSYQDTFAELAKSFRMLPPPLKMELDKELRRRHQTFDDHLAKLASRPLEQRQVAVLRLIQKLRPAMLAVSQSEIEQFYRTHQADFLVPEQKFYQAVSIAENVPDAHRKIDILRSSILQGVPLEQLARPFTPPPELVDAAGKLAVGDVSQVIQRDGAFCIVKYVGERKAFYMPLTEIAGYIKLQLRTEKTRRAIALIVLEYSRSPKRTP